MGYVWLGHDRDLDPFGSKLPSRSQFWVHNLKPRTAISMVGWSQTASSSHLDLSFGFTTSNPELLVTQSHLALSYCANCSFGFKVVTICDREGEGGGQNTILRLDEIVLAQFQL